MLRSAFILIAFILVGLTNNAQQNLLPLNRLRHVDIDQSARFRDSVQHTAIRPYLESKWDLTRIFGHAKDTNKYYYRVSTVAARDHMFEAREGDFWVAADPLFDLQLGLDLADTSSFQDSAGYYNNSRGAHLIGNLSKKVSFETFFYENQSQFPAYIRYFSDSTLVIPGQGRYKEFKNAGYDYNASWGWVSFSPNENLNFQLGHGKQFIGHGYRSMLLSDNAFNYPYARATAWLLDEKIQFSWIYAQLQNLERLPLGEVPESLFKRKAASFYYVNFIPVPAVEIGFFEGIIWQTWDEMGTQPFDYRTLIPVPGVNTAILGLEDANNALIGLNAKWKVWDKLHLYGQVAMDQSNSESISMQGGLKIFHLGLENLHLQAEHNYAPRKSYRHPDWLQAYNHMNQSLAHPLGTYFEETLAIINYRWRRVYGQLKYHHQVHENLDYGNQLLYPDNFDDESLFATNNIFDLQAGWLLTPKTNANLSIGWLHRNNQVGLLSQNTDWLYVTLRTSLVNKYYDF